MKSDAGLIAAVGLLGYLFINKMGNLGSDTADSIKELVTNNHYVEKVTDYKETLSSNWNTVHDTTTIYSQAGANKVQTLEVPFQEILNSPIHNRSNSKNYTLGGNDFNDIPSMIEDNQNSSQSAQDWGNGTLADKPPVSTPWARPVGQSDDYAKILDD